jgi:hypothetical protein
MRTKIKYIELKSNYNHNGPAWIGLVSYSKSGRTLYFNGKAFQRVGSDRMRGNYYDIENGDEYWISGFKKELGDRHKFGNGKIFVEDRIVKEYLLQTKQESLDKTMFAICTVDHNIPTEKINELENEKSNRDSEISIEKRLINPREMSDDELDYLIEYYNESSIEGRFLKGRKLSRKKRDDLITEKQRRENKNLC